MCCDNDVNSLIKSIYYHILKIREKGEGHHNHSIHFLQVLSNQWIRLKEQLERIQKIWHSSNLGKRCFVDAASVVTKVTMTAIQKREIDREVDLLLEIESLSVMSGKYLQILLLEARKEGVNRPTENIVIIATITTEVDITAVIITATPDIVEAGVLAAAAVLQELNIVLPLVVLRRQIHVNVGDMNCISKRSL